MKKLISIALAVALLVPFGATASAAASTLDERLEAITLSVKDTLGIGDDYTDFESSLNESDGQKVWTLDWHDDDEETYVEANENGKIIHYYWNYSGGDDDSYGNIHKFPAYSMDEAASIADEFLKKVLDTDIEWAELDSNFRYYSSRYNFSGYLTLNGLDTSVPIRLAVDGSTGKVTSYYRDDEGQDYSAASDPSAAIAAADASGTLYDTVNMTLAYATRDDDGTAYLQYTPDSGDTYVVDAITGELVDLTELESGYGETYNEYKSGGMRGAEASDSTSSVLTDIEREAVEGMEGVLDSAELEAAARAVSELGITDDFELDSIYYSSCTDDEGNTQIEASLEFGPANDDAAANELKDLVMDAETGKIISVDVWGDYCTESEDGTYTYTRDEAEATARSFAGKMVPDMLAECVLLDSTGDSGTSEQYFTFSRAVNGIIFPENDISVAVDADTGYVDSYDTTWTDDDIRFVSDTGAISGDDAADAYTAAVGTELRYVQVPADVQSSGMLLAYAFSDSSVWGVDATSGKILQDEEDSDEALEYGDLSGHWAESMIEKLAEYGVGFSGGSFQPEAQLTQKDALILITGAAGYDYSDGTDIEGLYDTAYYLDILDESEYDPDGLVTRADLAKYIVNALGYGEVAEITGIFTVDFADAGDIPSDLYGYVAIARGLGIIGGVPGGSFLPNDTAVRAQAAAMLYHYMST
ncbi:MAG: S-layer homology domain-containing protein [Oscillospiraceae bacterium]